VDEDKELDRRSKVATVYGLYIGIASLLVAIGAALLPYLAQPENKSGKPDGGARRPTPSAPSKPTVPYEGVEVKILGGFALLAAFCVFISKHSAKKRVVELEQERERKLTALSHEIFRATSDCPRVREGRPAHWQFSDWRREYLQPGSEYFRWDDTDASPMSAAFKCAEEGRWGLALETAATIRHTLLRDLVYILIVRYALDGDPNAGRDRQRYAEEVADRIADTGLRRRTCAFITDATSKQVRA